MKNTWFAPSLLPRKITQNRHTVFFCAPLALGEKMPIGYRRWHFFTSGQERGRGIWGFVSGMQNWEAISSKGSGLRGSWEPSHRDEATGTKAEEPSQRNPAEGTKPQELTK